MCNMSRTHPYLIDANAERCHSEDNFVANLMNLRGPTHVQTIIKFVRGQAIICGRLLMLLSAYSCLRRMQDSGQSLINYVKFIENDTVSYKHLPDYDKYEIHELEKLAQSCFSDRLTDNQLFSVTANTNITDVAAALRHRITTDLRPHMKSLNNKLCHGLSLASIAPCRATNIYDQIWKQCTEILNSTTDFVKELRDGTYSIVSCEAQLQRLKVFIALTKLDVPEFSPSDARLTLV